jgi:hypothetical protein
MFNIYFIIFMISLLFILKIDDKLIEDLGLNMDKNGVIKQYVIIVCLLLLPRVIAIDYVVYQDRNKG